MRRKKTHKQYIPDSNIYATLYFTVVTVLIFQSSVAVSFTYFQCNFLSTGITFFMQLLNKNWHFHKVENFRVVTLRLTFSLDQTNPASLISHLPISSTCGSTIYPWLHHRLQWGDCFPPRSCDVAFPVFRKLTQWVAQVAAAQQWQQQQQCKRGGCPSCFQHRIRGGNGSTQPVPLASHSWEMKDRHNEKQQALY